MYKFLLAWRYLRTRWIALASIISVTLGVGTMIVVNSVMAGFISEMQDRIHGILSDVVVESHGLDGFPDPARHMREIHRVAGDYIESMTATVQVPALLSFQFRDSYIKRQVQLVGIDPQTQSLTSEFGQYLQHPANRAAMSFDLREGGFDVVASQPGSDAHERSQLKGAGWPYRRWKAARQKEWDQLQKLQAPAQPMPVGGAAADAPRADGPPADNLAANALPADNSAAVATTPAEAAPAPDDPFARAEPLNVYDPAVEQSPGVVLGIGLSSFRGHDGDDRFLLLPGDDVKVTFPNAANPPRPVDATFTVVDFYESRMSEYDSQLVFVSIDRLQELCGMIDPATGVRYVNSIQIRVKKDEYAEIVRNKLRTAFPPEFYVVSTWKDKQGVLLAATQVEIAVLNLLLFMIIAVAGFGILAIFFMTVFEKTRDIGILKSLGATSRGVQSIFLGYGLSLGVVGAGAGMVLGLAFVAYINEIADVVGKITGREVFDPSIYYFYEIPTIVQPLTVLWIVAGAVSIAVMASILPARRAARLHPVEALRYE